MEELSEEGILAKDILQGIIKAKKLLKMYPQNNPIYIKTSEEMYSKFQSFFEKNNELSLRMFQNEIIFNNEKIYHNPQKEDNLALFFFKDGIREISFTRGFTQTEFEAFIKIINTDFENFALDDDIVTLMWEHDFEHIKYTVDEEVLSDDNDYKREQVYKEVKDKLYTDDDLEKAYQDGLKIAENQPVTLFPLSEAELKHIVKEIEKEEATPRIDKIIAILFELLYQTKEGVVFAEVSGFIETSMTYCIKNADFEKASSIIDSLKSIIKNKNFPQDRILSLEKILTNINSEPFIQEIAKIIDDESIEIEDSLIAFVKNLDKSSIPHFIKLMGELQSIKGRRIVINILSILGRLDVETIANGLYDNRWYVVRNIILILGKIADSRAIGYLTKPLSHTDPRVRKETIKAIGNIGGINTFPLLKAALNDPDPSVRLTVINILGKAKNDAAKHILTSEITDKSFSFKDFTEKKEFFEALTNWKYQDIRDILISALNRKKFFRRKRNDETRACAAFAIGIIGDKNDIPHLQKTVTSKNKILRTFTSNAIKQLNNQDNNG